MTCYWQYLNWYTWSFYSDKHYCVKPNLVDRLLGRKETKDWDRPLLKLVKWEGELHERWTLSSLPQDEQERAFQFARQANLFLLAERGVLRVEVPPEVMGPMKTRQYFSRGLLEWEPGEVPRCTYCGKIATHEMPVNNVLICDDPWCIAEFVQRECYEIGSEEVEAEDDTE